METTVPPYVMSRTSIPQPLSSVKSATADPESVTPRLPRSMRGREGDEALGGCSLN
jgi:hypothetical protein